MKIWPFFTPPARFWPNFDLFLASQTTWPPKSDPSDGTLWLPTRCGPWWPPEWPWKPPWQPKITIFRGNLEKSSKITIFWWFLAKISPWPRFWPSRPKSGPWRPLLTTSSPMPSLDCPGNPPDPQNPSKNRPTPQNPPNFTFQTTPTPFTPHPLKRARALLLLFYIVSKKILLGYHHF